MILNADARSIPLADESVQTVVTSPPYWGLRDYGVAEQIGQEESFEAWVAAMVDVFREVRRVLRDDGTVWLNLGDGYGGSDAMTTNAKALKGKQGTNGGTRGLSRRSPFGAINPKDLIGQPWAVAFALRADGWFLRSDIIWAKPNPMPESITDRPTKSHEYVFLLTKSARYYYDQEAVRLPAAEASLSRWTQNVDGQLGSDRANGGSKTNGPMRAVGGPRSSGQTGGAYNPPGQSPHGNARATKKRSVRPGIDTNGGGQGSGEMDYPALTANLRTVWSIPTQPFSEAHFATFPKALVIPCIKAGSAEGDVVLDPFAGSGTTGIVARKLVRRFVGLELNPDYCVMAERRIAKECPPNLFDEVPA